jgi:hypothetical protein
MRYDTIFWLENLTGKDHLEDLGVDGMILEWILEKYGGKMWSGCIRFRIGNQWQTLANAVMNLTFGFHERWEIS